jgi:cytochrome c-type biogenesis protein CcmH
VRRVLLIVALVLFAVACGRAPTPSERAHAIEAQVWSPYCPGRLLIDCTTTQARDLRTQIQQRVDRGDEPDEIIAWVRAEFGAEAIARPSATGAGLVIWLVPVTLFIAGLVVVVRVVRRARQMEGTSTDVREGDPAA